MTLRPTILPSPALPLLPTLALIINAVLCFHPLLSKGTIVTNFSRPIFRPSGLLFGLSLPLILLNQILANKVPLGLSYSLCTPYMVALLLSSRSGGRRAAISNLNSIIFSNCLSGIRSNYFFLPALRTHPSSPPSIPEPGPSMPMASLHLWP